MDCVFAERGADGRQVGTCKPSTGAAFDFAVGDESGGSSDGVRVFAGLRWDPFILDAPAALKTIATGQLQFTDAGSIYLDGKNVLSLVVELDCKRVLGDAGLVAVVAETRTRGSLSVRIERVGRPEIKNLMLGPKQFDQVNRDLEIRDLYNMEDAFELGESYQGAYRARLNANLAFWDSLDGAVDWPVERRRSAPADRAAARRLPRRRRHEAVRRGRLVPRARDGRAPRRGARDLRRPDAQRRRHGPAVHAGRQRRERADHPRRRRRVDAAVVAVFPYLAVPNPDPPKQPPPHSH